MAILKTAGLAITTLFGAAALWVGAQVWLAFDYGARAFLLGPDHTASTVLPGGTRLTAELVNTSPLGHTEYRRTLNIRTAEDSLVLRVDDDWGPARRTSVYRVGRDALAVLGPAHDDHFLSLSPLRRQAAPADLDSSRWVYVGAFDLRVERVDGERRHVLRFLKAEESRECVPTFLDGDEGGPYRAAAYAESC